MNFLFDINIIDIIRVFLINIYTIYTNTKILGVKKLESKGYIILIIGVLFLNVTYFFVEHYFRFISGVIYADMILATISSVVLKIKFGNAILVTTISLTVNYIFFLLAILVSFVIYKIFNINDYIIFFLIIMLYSVFIKVIFNIKRLNKGLIFIKKYKDNDYIDMLILNISSLVFLVLVIFLNVEEDLARVLLIFIIIFSVIMFVTIQKSLQLYYKQKMLVKDLEETKAELEKKTEEVADLEKENLKFSKVSHSIAHKQKALEHKLNELSMKSEIADEIDLKKRIENLNADLSREQVVVLDKTGITEIDDMLDYMQSECVKNKIDFQLQLSGNIYPMINHCVDKEELEILLADHIKNAIIAIGYGDNVNKSILVRLGKLDGNYGLYVYDSGIEFEIETLLNLGKKPSTTHKDSGGTGMGFMNTFDTLRKHKASFIIEEYGKPVKDNFTKALKFKFDKKEEYKICSYRAEEIKNVDKENTLVVEKL